MGGSFGDGESKIVRNLTKPPMVNNILEFISELLLVLYVFYVDLALYHNLCFLSRIALQSQNQPACMPVNLDQTMRI